MRAEEPWEAWSGGEQLERRRYGDRVGQIWHGNGERVGGQSGWSSRTVRVSAQGGSAEPFFAQGESYKRRQL